jgi:1,4-dihydroxy-2-naphthoate octaprenyltransferase
MATYAKTFARVTRAPFFTAVIVPVLLGATIAWYEGPFRAGYLILTLWGTVCAHAALNMSNDFFDHLSGNDEVNQELTPFSGGSRVIQDGILAPRYVLLISALLYVVGIAIGLYLAWTRGWTVLWLMLAGLLLAFFHNVPSFGLYYLAPGVGEVGVGLGFGPLAVLGSYYVQTQDLSLGAAWASIPVGLLIAAVLYINEFPDYRADRTVGKRTVVVALGRERARWGYVALLTATYASILAGVALRLMPWPALIALLSIPLAYRGIRGANRYHSDTPRLVPTNAITIQLHLATGFLLCAGYAIARFL